ncbi:hypothetical protein N4562_10575 [Ligilactobacillus agilis]|uniref:Lantibiotic dehydratase N-terminal domain-containing protein n=1 Tax=Ligilactobacillus agilis TaxID=1601 RepID=A0A9Q9MUK9_9LACO|nr:hypothetical protein [Ligilactobacillus agilis]UXC63453.1 hypothetical protein N4562_10575 [Ligilactobacillus agilis]UXC65452.1 hypothetical protein N4597_10570 [Ligilactobacillus agilis]
MPFFFRQNAVPANRFLDIFSNQANKIVDDFSRTDICFHNSCTSIIEEINFKLSNSSITDNEKVNLLQLRKIIHKEKNITKKLGNFSVAIEYQQIKDNYNTTCNNLCTKYAQLLNAQQLKLQKFFKESEIFLSKNPSIKSVNKNSTSKITNKLLLSLYGLACQLSLKTGAFGFTGKTGLLLTNGISNPKKEYVIRIQGYLMNRLYRNLLLNNLSSFTGYFIFNKKSVYTKNRLIYDTLLDNQEATLFINNEKKVSLPNNPIFNILESRGHVGYAELSKYLNDEIICKLIKLGIISYENMDKYLTFGEILSFFNIKDSTIINTFEYFDKKLKNLNTQYSKNIDLLSSFSKELTTFFKDQNISTLNNPVLTVDSFVKKENKFNNNNEYKTLSKLEKTLDLAARFFSTLDASKYARKYAYDYLINQYPKGIISKNSNIDIHSLLNNINKYIYNNTDLGKIRLGFVDFSIVKKIMHEFTLNDDIILNSKFINKYINSELPSRFHSYSFFIQRTASGFIINHIYKGYGVFTRRFWNNYSQHLNNNYGLSNLADFPYNFGFNVDYRVSNSSITTNMLPDTSITDTNIDSYKLEEINFYPDSQTKELKFLNKDKQELFFTYLGSLNPVAYPSLLLEINSITLNSSLYFDLGDLILRHLYAQDSNQTIYTVPAIYFLSRRLQLTRRKYLIKSEQILNMYDSNNILNSIYEITKKIPLVDFFIREFVVDFKKFNRKMRKPLYINIYQPISFLTFIQYLKKCTWVVLETPSPTIEYSLNKRLKEFIIETKAMI